MPIREKRILSGDILEVEIYQISNEQKKQSRRRKLKESCESQKNLNHKNSKKHLTRLINTNFTKKDVHLTLTYSSENLPCSREQAEKDMRNFLRRIKYRRKKRDLPELKYIAVVESSGEDGRSIRVHHHIIMSGDMNRDEIENIWAKGRCNSSRLQPDNRGFEGLAKYIAKEKKSGKRWLQSRNLKQPKVSINDHKYSRKSFDRLYPEECEEKYPGFKLCSFERSFNEITGNLGISVLMRRM